MMGLQFVILLRITKCENYTKISILSHVRMVELFLSYPKGLNSDTGQKYFGSLKGMGWGGILTRNLF